MLREGKGRKLSITLWPVVVGVVDGDCKALLLFQELEKSRDETIEHSFCLFFQELLRLEQDLTGSVSRWKGMWDKLESPCKEQLQRQMSINTQNVRSHGRSIHKRSTIELLVSRYLP